MSDRIRWNDEEEGREFWSWNSETAASISTLFVCEEDVAALFVVLTQQILSFLDSQSCRDDARTIK